MNLQTNMPQEKRRSISYRSFVICDDPRGVVECQAIRKSNVITPQKKEQPSSKIEGEKKQQNRNKTLAVLLEEEKEEVGNIEGDITRELEAPEPSVQLNNVIKSNSNGKKGNHKDIAKDLFKGALDLQKSLAMLKGPEKGLFGRLEDEKPCFSPRKSLDEMKKVVRESLLRQCVIMNPVFEHHFDNRKQLGSPDIPSSSSSQSSMVYSKFAPSDFSSFSTSSSPGKMSKSSSLIVKLMGLESFPFSPLRRRESEKILNLSKPVYDIVSPRVRKPHFGTEFSLKEKSVDEILEALKIKGLLKSNTVTGLMPNLLPCEVPPSENKSDDGKPPIVVMKPLSLPNLDLKKPIMPKLPGDNTSGNGDSKPKRQPHQETVRVDAPNFGEKRKDVEGRTRLEEKGKPVKKLASSKAKTSGNLNQKTQNTQETVKKASEVVKVTPNRRKVEEKKVVKSSGELRSRDQAKLITSRSQKQKDGMLISKKQIFSQQKTASTTVIDHKTLKTSKSSSQQENRRRLLMNSETQSSKGESKESGAVYEEKINSMSQSDSLLKTVDDMIVENFRSEKQAEASSLQIREHDIEEQISLSGPQEEVSVGANEDGNGHDSNDTQSSSLDITSASLSEHCNKRHLNEGQSHLPEVSLVTTHQNGISVNFNTFEEPTTDQPHNYHPSISQSASPSLREETDPETSRKFLTPRTKLKSLILSSPSFVSRAEDLFTLQVNPNSVPPTSNEEDLDGVYAKLLVDYANEVMDFRSLQLSQACVPLPRSYKSHPLNALSLDRLLEEICNGMEGLNGYLIPAPDMLVSDTLCLLIDQDLKFKGGTWEIGWKNAFSQDDVEKVIGEVDQLLLGKLIEEVLVDFML